MHKNLNFYDISMIIDIFFEMNMIIDIDNYLKFFTFLSLATTSQLSIHIWNMK
jgi:hypothetical protein